MTNIKKPRIESIKKLTPRGQPQTKSNIKHEPPAANLASLCLLNRAGAKVFKR